MSSYPLFDPESLYHAYRQCRKRKRHTAQALAFELDLEANLFALSEALNAGTYAPGPDTAFLVPKPKQREIFAADFRDWVVHHLLVGHLEPDWERRFIHDSYACRAGKGTHAAVDRLQSFLRKVSANGTRPAWYLQLDVKGFFVMLDRRILYKRLIAHEPDPIIQWLIRVILFRDPTANCRFRGSTRADHERLPPHKTLFKARPDCGLPIGNLTSQFFANVYLDALDQFVKHTLKARHYLRYCDDLVLLSPERRQLEEWERRIAQFLKDSLRLELNDRRKLHPVSNGVDFLGYIVRPHYRLTRCRVVGALWERLSAAEQRLKEAGMRTHPNGRQVFPYLWPVLASVQQSFNSYLGHLRHASAHRLRQDIPYLWPVLASVRQSFNSYLGHLRHASAHRLRQDIWQRFDWLEEYFWRQEDHVTFRCPIPCHALRYGQQTVWFCGHFPEHVIVVQRGAWWEVIGQGLFPLQAVPPSRLADVTHHLWQSPLPVVWIHETGRQISRIAERAVGVRWSWCSDAHA
jgi:RNA-directed DNA polymerase